MTMTTQATRSPSGPRHRSRVRMQMSIVPLIDVVFLLLVFFLLTASFRPLEGFLPTKLPQQSATAEPSELEPVPIQVFTLPNGDCQVQIGSQNPILISADAMAEGFLNVKDAIHNLFVQQGRTTENPIKLIPTAQTKWDHVVKTYHCLWQLNLTKVIFAIVE
jgi:biopolymer transport protein ExbD